MSTSYAEDWDGLVWDVIRVDHPQHVACEGFWREAGSIVCCCGVVLFSVRTIPPAGELL